MPPICRLADCRARPRKDLSPFSKKFSLVHHKQEGRISSGDQHRDGQPAQPPGCEGHRRVGHDRLHTGGAQRGMRRRRPPRHRPHRRALQPPERLAGTPERLTTRSDSSAVSGAERGDRDDGDAVGAVIGVTERRNDDQLGWFAYH